MVAEREINSKTSHGEHKGTEEEWVHGLTRRDTDEEVHVQAAFSGEYHNFPALADRREARRGAKGRQK